MLSMTGSTGRCTLCICRASELSRRSLLSPVCRQPARCVSSKTTPLAGEGPLRVRKTWSSRSVETNKLYLEQKRHRGVVRAKRASHHETTYSVFGRLLEEQLMWLRGSLLRGGLDKLAAWNLNSKEEVYDAIDRYQDHLREVVKRAEKGDINKTNNPDFYQLRESFVEGNVRFLVDELKHSFVTFLIQPKLRMSLQQSKAQGQLADLRYPTEWYPATRAIQRTIHLHIGPTNSGKTYHALKKLEAAKTGIYAGPLRLLAHEVYTRFNASGKPCALITGEERRVPPGLSHVMQSCTVEMVTLNAKVDVAVIDEIQMIGDEERGWAWTQALLGIQAKELHLCGEVRTEELIRRICALTGEKLVIHRYERLNPLETEDTSLRGKLTGLRKGDAVIVFNRLGIHAMKSSIEKTTGRRCAVVYGSLPPETRAQQAALFNDPNNDYDFLVASDAVGMGLNLSIRRVVFESTSKNDGHGYRLIRPWEIKQIGGRAGRFKTAHQAVAEGPDGNGSKEEASLNVVPLEPSKQNVGYVTSFDKFDLPIIRKAMETDVPPLKNAIISPPNHVIHRFASYFPPEIPFSYIYLRLHKTTITSPIFKLARIKEEIQVVDLIQHVDLSIADRMTFLKAPVALREDGFADCVIEMAECVANHSSGELLDLKTMNLELLELDIHEHPDRAKGYLKAAEGLHKALTLYLWLSYRYDGIFTSQALAFYTKSLVEKKIDECLAEVHWDQKHRERVLNKRIKDLMKEAKQRNVSKKVVGDDKSVENDLDDEISDTRVSLHDPLFISSAPRERSNSIAA